MTDALTHATVNALRTLRGEPDVAAHAWRLACGSSEEHPHEAIGMAGIRDTIPTCPKCAVMRDAALEGKEVTT
jgi:hypothetical protein